MAAPNTAPRLAGFRNSILSVALFGKYSIVVSLIIDCILKKLSFILLYRVNYWLGYRDDSPSFLLSIMHRFTRVDK